VLTSLLLLLKVHLKQAARDAYRLISRAVEVGTVPGAAVIRDRWPSGAMNGGNEPVRAPLNWAAPQWLRPPGPTSLCS
jgi:hypothetical protein